MNSIVMLKFTPTFQVLQRFLAFKETNKVNEVQILRIISSIR